MLRLGSADPDGHRLLTYAWTQSDGPPVTLFAANSIAPTFTAPGGGTMLTFTLRVSDSTGLVSAEDTVVITVRGIGIAGLIASNDGPSVLGPVTPFNAVISAGSAVSYTWFFGDGVQSSGISATHVYSALGRCAAFVIASNSNGSVVAQTLVVVRKPTALYLPLLMR
jgi:hypothetical protein